ncbi:nuclear transport factor 2 family protein [Myxococcota bacterium]|nr:nuclear transport factor 2 family protein [Myxococcota bacterium]
MSTPNRTHLETIQTLYAAFGRGDVDAIMALLSPAIEWDVEQVGAAAELPWLRPRRGLDEVRGFFGDLAANVDLQRFEPRGLFAGLDGAVMGVFYMEGVVRRTGRRVVDSADTHLWEFDTEGRVARMRHIVDTLQHVRAWQG